MKIIVSPEKRPVAFGTLDYPVIDSIVVMATRRSGSEPPPIQVKEFTTSAEIDRATAKLRNRVEDVKALDPSRIRYNDQSVYNVMHAIQDSILEVFGPNSPEYSRHRYFYFGENVPSRGPNDGQEKFAVGIGHALSMLEGLIKRLEEKRAEIGHDPVGRVHSAFEGLDLHPRIADATAELFGDGHYRNAVLDGCLALVNFVGEKSRRHDLDGAPLMRAVFSRNKPVLAFSDLKDQSEMDEQEGLMHIFEGVMLALRNPRAHELTPDSPEETLEFITLLNFLAKQLERAKRRKDG